MKDELYKFYTGLQIKLSDLNKVARVYLEHIQELEDIEANYANIEAAYELAKGYKTLLSEYLDYDLDNIEHACELVDKLENDKHEVSSRIKQLKDIFSKDFGPNNEFFLLVDECVQHKQGLYTYEVCFFKEATQSERGNRVNIGKFDKFDDNYRTIYFTNGTKCPNGVSRSLKISLECSDEMKVLSVTEPHICEYSMGMTSPYVCSEEYIQEYIRNHS